MSQTTDLLTTAQAAAVIGVSVPTVTRMARRGELEEFHKLPGLRGPRVFTRDEVARVAAERNNA